MKKASNQKCLSRRHLSDSKLGMNYNERLKLTKVDVFSGEFKIKDYKTGYAIIVDKIHS